MKEGKDSKVIPGPPHPHALSFLGTFWATVTGSQLPSHLGGDSRTGDFVIVNDNSLSAIHKSSSRVLALEGTSGPICRCHVGSWWEGSHIPQVGQEPQSLATVPWPLQARGRLRDCTW